MPGTPGIPVVPPTPPPGAKPNPADAAPPGEPVPGVAAAQLCGTDIAPTKVARPTPADTADPPRLGADASEPTADPTGLNPAAPAAAGAVAPDNRAGFRPPKL